MADFDPDAYLKQPSSDFDPDAYLSGASPGKQILNQGMRAVTDIPSEIGNEASEGWKGFTENRISPLHPIESAKAVMGAARAATSPGLGVAHSVLGHGMTAAEIGAGEYVVNPLLKAAGVPESKLQHPDPEMMYGRSKQDVDTALSAVPGGPLKGGLPRTVVPPPIPPTSRFGVTLSRGEELNDLATRQMEQGALRKQAGEPAVGHAQEFYGEQRPAELEQAKSDISRQLDTGGQELVAPNEEGTAETQAAGMVQRSLQRESARSKQNVSDLYQQAKDAGGELSTDHFNNLPGLIKEGLSDPNRPGGAVLVNERTPNSSNMLDFLNEQVARLKMRNKADPLNPQGVDANGMIKVPNGDGTFSFQRPQGITLEGVDNWRKTLSGMRASALKNAGTNAEDARAAQAIMDAFDHHINAGVNDPTIFTGNPDAVNAWNSARAAHSARMKLYGNDAIGKKIQAVIGDPRFEKEPATLNKIAEWLYGASGTTSDIGFANRVKRILGEDSPEWAAVRQGLFRRLVSKPEGSTGDFGYGTTANRIANTLSGKGSDLANAVFRPQDKDLIRAFGDLYSTIQVPQAGANWPNTAGGVIHGLRHIGSKIIGALTAIAAHTMGLGVVGEGAGYIAGERVGRVLNRYEDQRNLRLVQQMLPVIRQRLAAYQQAVIAANRGPVGQNQRLAFTTNALVNALGKIGIDHPVAMQMLTQGPSGPGTSNAQQRARGGKVAAEKALPKNHQLGMRVPKGGSSCSSCFFFKKPTTCRNAGFVAWNHGSSDIPGPPDEYCCDNYQHTFKRARGGKVPTKIPLPDLDTDNTDALADKLIEEAQHFADGGTPTFDERFSGLNPSEQMADQAQDQVTANNPPQDWQDTEAQSNLAAINAAKPGPSAWDTAKQVGSNMTQGAASFVGNVGNAPEWIYEHPKEVQEKVKNLLGIGEGERYQTWPERMVRSGASLAHDVMTGDVPAYEIDPKTGEAHTSTEMIERAQDMSGMAGSGGLASAEEGAVLNATPSLRPALKYQGKIYKAPPGGEHMDAIPASIYPEFQRQAMSGEDISNFNFGFMNHKGQFLNREQALDYAIQEGLVSPHEAKYGALTSPILRSESSEAGAPLAALEHGIDLKKVDAEPPPGHASVDTYNITKGDQNLGHVLVDRSDPTRPHIMDIRAEAGPNSLGTNATRAIAQQLKQQYPEAKQITGYRSTGANPGRSVLYSDTSEPGAAIAGLASRSKEPFYSQVEQTIQSAPQSKMQGVQWANWLKNQPGVKPDELQYTGLDNWLREQKGPVTKQQVQEQFKQNKIGVQDVVKGEKGYNFDEDKEMDKAQELASNYIRKKYPRLDDESDEFMEKVMEKSMDILHQKRKVFEGGNFNEDAATEYSLDRAHEQMETRFPTLDQNSDRYFNYTHDIAGEIYDQLERSHDNKGGTKYASWQLPGGENYREHLITLPSQEYNAQVRAFGKERGLSIEDAYPAYDRERVAQRLYRRSFDSLPQEMKNQVYSDLRNNRNEALGSRPEDYKSSHWDEPNILAHVRSNERDVGGVPSLHLEELQSDWHQAGRKQGYRDANRAAVEDARKQTFENLINKLKEAQPNISDGVVYKLADNLIDTVYRGDRDSFHTKEEHELAQKFIDADKKFTEFARQSAVPRVPDAPFKKDWPELAMKRMIRQAAEEGKSRISWTPGEAQAARYDLSKQIDNLRWNPKTGNLMASKGNNPVFSETGVTEDNLADFVGKDVAEKLVNQPAKEDFDQGLHIVYDQKNDGYSVLTKDGDPPPGMGQFSFYSKPQAADALARYVEKRKANTDFKELSGLDLKVGGEGMKGFYDQMLPKMVEKLGKQYGVKVKEGSIGGREYSVFQVKNGLINGEDGMYAETTSGKKMPDGWYPLGEHEEDPSIGPFQTKEQAQKSVARFAQNKVHYFDIPEKMKQDALTKGFALFSDTTKPGAALSGLEHPKIVNLAERREQKEVGKFHKGLMSEVADKARERAKVAQEYHENGKLPFAVGTRFSTEHSRRNGLLPLEVTGHYVDSKNPEKYGYYYTRGPEEEKESGIALVNDPNRPNVAELSKQFTPFTGIQKTKVPTAEENRTQAIMKSAASRAGQRTEAFVAKQNAAFNELSNFVDSLNKKYETSADWSDFEKRKYQQLKDRLNKMRPGDEKNRKDGGKVVRPEKKEEAARARGGKVVFSEINHRPTDPQKDAGNYKKEHIHILGLPITIENAKGSYRTGKGWKAKVYAHYGYIVGHQKGHDGDHVDVYVGPHIRSKKVFVVNQVDANTKKFDEHKCMLGFATLQQAVDTYIKGFSDGKGKDRIGSIVESTIDDFRDWLRDGDTHKPYRTNYTYGKVKFKGITLEQQV